MQSPAPSHEGFGSDPASAEPSQRVILIIDDEPSVCMIAARLLQRLGFNTETATDGEAGLQIFRADPHRFCLVMVDLTMPEPDGEQLVRELHKIDPEAKVLMMSGFAEETVCGRFPEGAVAGFLQKPFNPAGLAAKVQATLS